MLQSGGSIWGSHDPVLAAVSLIVAVLVSYTLLDIASRVAATQGSARAGWLLGGGLAVGGGIWSAHFIAMLGLYMPGPVNYRLDLWLASVLTAIAAAILVLHMAGRKHLNRSSFAWTALLVGIAFAGVHYLGVAAMHFPGVITWNFPFIWASIGMALIGAGAVLWFAFRLRNAESRRGRFLRLATALVLGPLFIGTHYMGMAGADFLPRAAPSPPLGIALPATAVAITVLIGTAGILSLAIVGGMVDRELRRRSSLATENARLFEEAERARQEVKSRAEQAEDLAAELNSSNARMRAIVESSLDAVITTDADGIITDWSLRASQIFDRSRDESLGLRFSETLLAPAFRKHYEEELLRFLRTGEAELLNRRVEVTACRKDGSEFPVELAVAAARWGDQVIFSSFVRDITERRLAQRRMAAEYAVTRALADTRPFEAVVPDLLEEIGTALGWTVGLLWVPDDSGEALVEAGFWQSPTIDASPFRKEAGERRFAPGEGLPGRAWEEGEPVWLLNLTEENGFPANGAALQMGLRSGVAFPVRVADETLGVFEFFDRTSLEPNRQILDMLGALGSEIAQSILRVRAEAHRDRLLTEMESVNERLTRANTELAQRSAEAERARALADEANRAKSDFLANMSHELRTPINAIVGYVDLLDLELAGPITEKQREHLGRVRVSSRHLLGLIDDILDLAKVEAGRIGVVRMKVSAEEVVSQALSLIYPQAEERDVAIRNECTDKTVAFVADEGRVRQILVNLLTNAVKFTEPGGKITVRCATVPETPPGVELAGRTSWTCLQVEDTGIGISPEEKSFVFQPFVQAERGRARKHGGTGLGLTISRRFARLMGGDLTLESELGRGSCFTLWLPTDARASDRALPIPSPDEKRAFAEVGAHLLRNIPTLSQRYTDKIREDPFFSSAESLPESDIVNHLPTFLGDLGLAFLALDDAEAATATLLRDGSEIQEVIAERHGVQRARLGWTEGELSRDYEVLRREIENNLSSAMEGIDITRSLVVLGRLLDRAKTASIRAHRGIVGIQVE